MARVFASSDGHFAMIDLGPSKPSQSSDSRKLLLICPVPTAFELKLFSHPVGAFSAFANQSVVNAAGSVGTLTKRDP